MRGTRTWASVRSALACACLMGFVACGDDAAPTAASPKGWGMATEAASSDAAAHVAPQATTPAAAEPRSASNSSPHIRDLRLDPEEPSTGETVRAIVDVEDADGDSVWLSYHWQIAGVPQDNDSGKIVLAGATKGQLLELSVVASDGKVESAPKVLWVSLKNAKPRLDRLEVQPSSELVAGMDIVLRPDARDADGDALDFEYEWSVNGRSVRSAGPVFSTAGLRRGDRVRAVVTADDGESRSVPISTPDLAIANAPPKILSRPGAPAEDGVFRYQVKAEDPDGDRNLQFYLEKAPEGMSVDPLSGAITWAPAPDQLGTQTVSVVVDDLQGGRGRQTFEISVGDSQAVPAKAR